ncbi:MAG: LysM peptidoglycan-binding domain-containing protein [Lentisphaeria bacterium]
MKIKYLLVAAVVILLHVGLFGCIVASSSSDNENKKPSNKTPNQKIEATSKQPEKIIKNTSTESLPKNDNDSVTQYEHYTVKAGDNLTRIAQRYNTTVQILIKENNLKNSVITPGRKLVIPKQVQP